MASRMRSWTSSVFLTTSPLPAASLQNDLNKGAARSQRTNSQGQASQSLEEEKYKLLAEAAVELQEENTRQERILALAKRLAVLKGQDPSRGKGSSQHPSSGPLAKTYCHHRLYFPLTVLKQIKGPCAKGHAMCHAELRCMMGK